MRSFKLSPSFLEQYKDQQPEWGPVGYITYKRTYARALEDGTTEEFWQTCQRVIEGVYSVQKEHCKQIRLPWNNEKAQKSAQEMFRRMWEFKWLPPGRGLWMMGTDYVSERGSAALNNCGLFSTKDIKDEFAEPFCWLMDMLMLGVGVGFDTKGAGTVTIREPKIGTDVYLVEDTREGWVELLRRFLNPYVGKGTLPLDVDYSNVRPEGAPIAGFGGTASGPGPLKELIESVQGVLHPLANQPITSTAIVDISNLVGRCVVAGNVRRSAQIAFGDPHDAEFSRLKNPEYAGDALLHHRWASNNSIFADVGMDYSEVAAMTAVNGEPGYEWLENAQEYSRMGHPPDFKDHRALGGNPCFTGDTLVAVADGRNTVSLKQLAEEAKDVPVYSMNPETGEVSIKWGRVPRKTQENAELVRVHLESGGHVDCTPNHKWLLNDRTWKEAKDLLPGDSLSKFIKRQEYVEKNGNKYWRVYTQGEKSTKGRIFEHRLVAQFFDPATYEALYDASKQNGWIKGGLVVHHKNYNPLDNRPENLEWMTFRDHAQHHADFDRAGENNGMFGKTHSEETKRKIGDKTLERTSDDSFRAKLSASHTEEERSEASLRMQEMKKEWDKEYYLEQEASTDIETVWVGERMFAKKCCEVCSTEFVVDWGKRHRVHCSARCSSQYLAGLDKRKNNQRQHFQDKQKDTLHQQVMVYKDLEQSLGRQPKKKEWEAACKSAGVSFRIRTDVTAETHPHALLSFTQLVELSQDYNDRVSFVERLSNTEDVYCMTVDDNHTMVIVPNPKASETTLFGINVFQCLEQTLEDRELCCLVESFPSRHDSFEDFRKTLKYAYLYAKSVTLIPTHNERTNAVLLRNRRIGCSMSGIVQAMNRHGRRNFLNWCDEGYNYLNKLDDKYSSWLCVPQSIKKTSVKPSGTISLLPGVTPGIHFPHSEYYIRRIRFQTGSSLLSILEQHGYPIEDDVYSPNTKVVSFPIHEKYFDRSKSDVSMWEQLELAAQLQSNWADNQVSVTVTVTAAEASQIKYALELYETRLKGVSFLPEAHGYEQAPYETITKEQYESMAVGITPISNILDSSHEQTERFCDGGMCEIPVKQDVS